MLTQVKLESQIYNVIDRLEELQEEIMLMEKILQEYKREKLRTHK